MKRARVERLLELARARGDAGPVEVPEAQRSGCRYYAAAGLALAARAPGDAVPGPADGEHVELDAVINTGVVDRYNTILDPLGCDFSAFMRNPVLLWQHGHDVALGSIPVGEVLAIEASRDAITARVRFYADGPGAAIADLYRLGRCRGFSVGFIPLEVSVTEVPGRDSVVTFTRWELAELSAVAVPANPDALARSLDSIAAPEVAAHVQALLDAASAGRDPDGIVCAGFDCDGSAEPPPAAVPDAVPPGDPAPGLPAPASDRALPESVEPSPGAAAPSLAAIEAELARSAPAAAPPVPCGCRAAPAASGSEPAALSVDQLRGLIDDALAVRAGARLSRQTRGVLSGALDGLRSAAESVAALARSLDEVAASIQNLMNDPAEPSDDSERGVSGPAPSRGVSGQPASVVPSDVLAAAVVPAVQALVARTVAECLTPAAEVQRAMQARRERVARGASCFR